MEQLLRGHSESEAQVCSPVHWTGPSLAMGHRTKFLSKPAATRCPQAPPALGGQPWTLLCRLLGASTPFSSLARSSPTSASPHKSAKGESSLWLQACCPVSVPRLSVLRGRLGLGLLGS